MPANAPSFEAPAPPGNFDDQQKKRKRTRLLGLGAIILLLLAVGIVPRLQRRNRAAAQARQAEEAVPVVSAARATAAPAVSELLLPGNTQAITEASIYARSNGYVRERLVDIGTKVKAGQLLAVIESPEIDQELDQAKANSEQTRAALEQANANLQQSEAALNQAKANLAQAHANEEISRLSYARWDRLVNRGVVSKQAADERRTDFSAKQAEVAAAEASIRTAEANIVAQRANIGASQAALNAQLANVRRLEEVRAFERLVAPFDGVITARKVERGDLVTAGSGSDRNLFSIAQARVLRIQVNVPQSFSVDLQPGQVAEVLVQERPGERFEGKVVRTANALDPASRTLLAEVQVPNDDGRLLPGMYSQVKFALARAHAAVIIPADTLVVNSQGTRVIAVTADNTVHYLPVQLGRDFGTSVDVLDGLKAGQTLVSNPADTLSEGQQIQVQARSGRPENQKSN
jgi:RND family efflux transporter MFP subunit